MFKIRTMFSRTPTTNKTPTRKELLLLGQALSAERARLAEIRQLPIDELDRLYREATGQ